MCTHSSCHVLLLSTTTGANARYTYLLILFIIKVSKLLRQEQTDDYCLPFYFSKMILVLGPFFHILNAYWFYKIIRKIIRKLTGEEKLNERNDLVESEHDGTDCCGTNGKKRS